jgi:hypothetical protein
MRRLIVLLGLIPMISQDFVSSPTSFVAPAGSYALLQVRVEDGAAMSAAAAVDVLLDGRRDQTILLTPGAGRPAYGSLLGPLQAGSHEIRLVPSPLWKWDASLRLSSPTVEVIPAGDTRALRFAHAPALGLRSDTIGTASDLPLMMYVEDSLEGASRWLRYTVIFSHEDGGTPGVALMARWGRTADIELAYEVELRDGRAVRGRYQGPDHRVIERTSVTEPRPLLLVSTLNNMFLDRGHAAAVVRLVPELVDLSGRSRESVMDDRAWIYRVMARELAAERPADVGDPRDYVYVDLKLESRGAAVAVGARAAGGTTRWSDRGRSDLVVSRQGELRIAVPTPATEVVGALMIRCDSRVEPGQQPAPGARCAVDVRKLFRLGGDYAPSDNLLEPARLTVEAGTAQEIVITQPPRARIER